MTQPVPPYMHAMLLTGHGGLDKLHYRDDVTGAAAGAG